MRIAIDDPISRDGIELVTIEVEVSIEELEPILAPAPSSPIPPPMRLG